MPAGSAHQGDHPPKPRLALSVGVIGHRPKDLAKALPPDAPKDAPSAEIRYKKVVNDISTVLVEIENAARQALKDHHDIFDESQSLSPALTLVSALAAGTDSIAAEVALGLKYALDVPLPFSQADYELDFDTAPGSGTDATSERDQFRALRAQARAVLELPGRRQSPPVKPGEDDPEANRAYEAAGLTVLSQADVLLAVWDRGPSRGRGGTAEMVAEAARAGIPIILVDAYGMRPIEVLWRNFANVPAPIVAIDDLPTQLLETCIQKVINELVRMPGAVQERKGFERWFRERQHCFNPRLGYPLLTTFMVVRTIKCVDIVPKRPGGLAKEFTEAAGPVVRDGEGSKIALIANAYGWADAIGIWCAQIFRGAFLMNFLFAAAAVVVASAGVIFNDKGIPFPEGSITATLLMQRNLIGAEILLILFVVSNTYLGRRQRWQHRWVEAREVAERLRAALPLWALGLRPAFFPGEEPSWTGWYTRAVVRMQGMRSGTLGPAGLADARMLLLNLLTSQCNYNSKNGEQMDKLERRLERIGFTLFVATAAIAIDHFNGSQIMHCLVGPWPPAHELEIWLSAALPSLATATYGIRVIGDFEGAKRRSEHTHLALDQLTQALNKDHIDLATLRARARSAADAMLGDVASWRLAAESRGLAIPG
jgi:hypothetical protein